VCFYVSVTPQTPGTHVRQKYDKVLQLLKKADEEADEQPTSEELEYAISLAIMERERELR
jgi:hypothetical protein